MVPGLLTIESPTRAANPEVRRSLCAAARMDRNPGVRMKAIEALQQYGGTVIRTSLSDEDTKKLQDALNPETQAAAS